MDSTRPRFDPAPPSGLTTGRGSGGGAGGGEDGVPEPAARVSADPTGQPRLHHRLRPHYRRCGEPLQHQLLTVWAGFDRVSGKLGFGPLGEPEELIPGWEGAYRVLLCGVWNDPETAYPVTRKENASLWGGGSGLQASF